MEDVTHDRSKRLRGCAYERENETRPGFCEVLDRPKNGEGACQAFRSGGYVDPGELQ